MRKRPARMGATRATAESIKIKGVRRSAFPRRQGTQRNRRDSGRLLKIPERRQARRKRLPFFVCSKAEGSRQRRRRICALLGVKLRPGPATSAGQRSVRARLGRSACPRRMRVDAGKGAWARPELVGGASVVTPPKRTFQNHAGLLAARDGADRSHTGNRCCAGQRRRAAFSSRSGETE